MEGGSPAGNGAAHPSQAPRGEGKTGEADAVPACPTSAAQSSSSPFLASADGLSPSAPFAAAIPLAAPGAPPAASLPYPPPTFPPSVAFSAPRPFCSSYAAAPSPAYAQQSGAPASASGLAASALPASLPAAYPPFAASAAPALAFTGAAGAPQSSAERSAGAALPFSGSPFPAACPEAQGAPPFAFSPPAPLPLGAASARSTGTAPLSSAPAPGLSSSTSSSSGREAQGGGGGGAPAGSAAFPAGSSAAQGPAWGAAPQCLGTRGSLCVSSASAPASGALRVNSAGETPGAPSAAGAAGAADKARKEGEEASAGGKEESAVHALASDLKRQSVAENSTAPAAAPFPSPAPSAAFGAPGGGGVAVVGAAASAAVPSAGSAPAAFPQSGGSVLQPPLPFATGAQFPPGSYPPPGFASPFPGAVTPPPFPMQPAAGAGGAGNLNPGAAPPYSSFSPAAPAPSSSSPYPVAVSAPPFPSAAPAVPYGPAACCPAAAAAEEEEDEESKRAKRARQGEAAPPPLAGLFAHLAPQTPSGLPNGFQRPGEAAPPVPGRPLPPGAAHAFPSLASSPPFPPAPGFVSSAPPYPPTVSTALPPAPPPFPAAIPLDKHKGSLVDGLGAFGLAQYHCDVCTKDISNVCRIRCAECEDFDLCVACFCMGAEVEGKAHKNSHSYIPIGRNAFPLLRHKWTADEELRLLEGVSKYGFGNWSVGAQKQPGGGGEGATGLPRTLDGRGDVAELVNNVALTPKTSQECDQHYTEVYLNSRTSPLPDTSTLLMSKDGGPLKEERRQEETRKTRGGKEEEKDDDDDKERENADGEAEEEDSARPAGAVAPPSRAGTAKPTHSIVGYWPLRGDFDVEYDNDAELILADMEFKEDEAVQERHLKLQVIEIYNSKLDERIYRKRTVINRGLLDTKTLHQREKKRTKEERDLHNLFKPLARFHSDEEQERLVQLLIEEKRIRARLSMLHEWRSLGLKTADDVGAYEGDKRWREQLQRFRASELSSLFFSGGLASLFAKHVNAQQTGKLPPAAGVAPPHLPLAAAAAGLPGAVAASPSLAAKQSGRAAGSPSAGGGGVGNVGSAAAASASSAQAESPQHANVNAPNTPRGGAATAAGGVGGGVDGCSGGREREAEKGKREGKDRGDGARPLKGARAAIAAAGDKELEALPISAFPGAALLTAKEQAFCEDAQLAPVFYLLAKRMLLREMSRHKKFNATDFSKPMELFVNRVGQLYDFYVNVSDFAPCCPAPAATAGASRAGAPAASSAPGGVAPGLRPFASPAGLGAASASSAFYRTVTGATPGVEPVYNAGVPQPYPYGFPPAGAPVKLPEAPAAPRSASPRGRASQGC
ncbi:ADA2-A transcriptional co-activator SAGA component [Besnoitia besnoiti]|uniref:ADA2-A transcriptional co-activator SAGA component n=1 Tax=Besnoitia besnoiti TaxID=94643 RepID=A0A2A9M512_BESBE|nr:ADA2-A transcriptional co-activator SAGA component [Besnoitia besnoiti]PFH33578.1 ADA2-A transcriptional co-activator SAGA component [Besnoitia besnoiti]